MNVYIVIGSNEDESDYRIVECFCSEERAYRACSNLNRLFLSDGFSFYVVCREIEDYDRKK